MLKMPLPINELFEILPHRYPFLLIDRVISLSRDPHEGKNAVGTVLRAIKNVTFNEPFFQGHFPGNPIMPGVLIIEAMAQASALLAHKPKPGGGRWTFYIVSIDKARFRKIVTPGDQLILEMTCLKDRGTLFVFQGNAFVGDDLVAEAEIMAKMV